MLSFVGRRRTSKVIVAVNSPHLAHIGKLADIPIRKQSRQRSISLASMCRTWSCQPKNTAKTRTVSSLLSTSNQ